VMTPGPSAAAMRRRAETLSGVFEGAGTSRSVVPAVGDTDFRSLGSRAARAARAERIFAATLRTAGVILSL
jgi:hypothetical protein